ncbi:nuclear transport factor 2 family protein [Aurantiacibacter gilvus]|uniref:Nuclear transport factor 2 family protein n=1 Tax=Aurantiacibacter gilvus TaxID=3139141 RepID=A0ABU9IH98_9SPHN
MRRLLLLAGIAAMLAAPAAAQMRPAEPVVEAELSSEQAEILALEQQWGQAFLDGDYDFIEALVAPEFHLVVHEGAPFIIPREPWLANTRRWHFASFTVEVLDIAVTGDTAVAVLRGTWQVDEDGVRIIDEAFFLTDTFANRDGNWQVIRRHSQTIADNMPADD